MLFWKRLHVVCNGRQVTNAVIAGQFLGNGPSGAGKSSLARLLVSLGAAEGRCAMTAMISSPRRLRTAGATSAISRKT